MYVPFLKSCQRHQCGYKNFISHCVFSPPLVSIRHASSEAPFSTQLLVRFSIQIFEKANRPRVLRRNFAQLQEAVAIQKWMRSAKAKADSVSNLSIQRRVFRGLRAATAVAAASRRLRDRADAFAHRKLVMTGWEALREHPAEKKVLMRKKMCSQPLLRSDIYVLRLLWRRIVQCTADTACSININRYVRTRQQ